MSHWKPGDRVAERFVVEGFLASGGMAEIYVAEMTLMPGVKRRVALKRIHSNLAEDPHFVTMFLDEARVASQLQHPGVVPVRDVIEVEGELLLILDYVPGWDLASVLKKSREKKVQVPIGAALYIARSIAETLDYVHNAVDLAGRPLGIVHRDVNPSNIQLAEDGTVRLLDFGVAKAAARMTHTATNAIKGKLTYLAPEQASNGAIDARTDLYGLGLIAFEMITGTRALNANGELALLEVARRPTHARVSALRTGVPSHVDDLIARLLSIDPRARPERGAEVARGFGVPARAQQALQGFVAELMGVPARAIRDAQRPLDVALRAIAGLDTGGPITAEQAGTGPAPPLAPLARAPVSLEPLPPPPDTLLDPPRKERSRLLIPAIVVGVLILGSGASFLLRDSASSQAVPPTSPAKGFLRITSEPKGAAIFVDDIALAETTPAIIERTAGSELTIRTERDDYTADTKRATPIAGATTDVAFTLARKPGHLIVKSTPSEARVFIDDREAGTTPLELDTLPRNAITVRVEAPGRMPKTERVDLASRADATLEMQLEADIPTGTLDISSTPWARVHVDAKLVAESTPVIGLRLSAGKHKVALSNPRLGKAATRMVEIKAAKRTSLIVRLDQP